MLHLSQQQEALYFVEVRNSKWTEHKWRDTNSRLTASWMALCINRSLFTHGDWGFHEIGREQVEIMVIRWLCRVSKNAYEWVKFHLKRPMYYTKQESTDVSFHVTKQVCCTQMDKNQVSVGSQNNVLLNILVRTINNNYIYGHHTQFLFRSSKSSRPITKMLSVRKYSAKTRKWQIVIEQHGNWQYCF